MKSIVDYTNELKDFFASKQALTTKLSIADLTSISDCDNLPSNSIAFISNSATAHLPWAVRSTIITCEVLDSPVRKFQVAFTFNNEIYIRDYSGSWLEWKLVGADMGNNIAPIENGTNYSTSYTKGAQFINHGFLCEVTASSVNSSTAISIGGAGNAKYADSVTKQISNFVKSDTYTGTTNANGIIDTSLSVSERSIIYAIASGRIVETVNGTGYWTFKILNATDMQPIQNASVSIAYKYI